MKGDGLNEAAIAAFKHNYEQLVAGADGIVPEGSIDPIEVSAASATDTSYFWWHVRVACCRHGYGTRCCLMLRDRTCALRAMAARQQRTRSQCM